MDWKYKHSTGKLYLEHSNLSYPNAIVFNGNEYIAKLEKPKEVYLTEFQKLIVNCKPEINKPVFVLCGAGVGKTFALNERAKKVNFLYFHPNPYLFKEYNISENINVGLCSDGYEEVVLEGTDRINYMLKVFPNIFEKKRVIAFTNGVDFVKDFANRLKGEYTIISGFNVYDNPYLNNSTYEECLNSLHANDRKRYLDGGF